jgi:hypothetical protein
MNSRKTSLHLVAGIRLAVAIWRTPALAAVLVMLAACATSPVVSESSRIHAEVNEIIQEIEALPTGPTSASKQQALFDQLVAKGSQAVPAIVELMDDRHPLPVPMISLENESPGAFEGRRHYGPKLMVDALAAVLNQITGENFGSIYNGASEQERRSAVNAWRDYARTRSP